MPPEICRRVLIRRRKNNIARVPLLSPYNKAIFAKTLRLQQTAHMFVDVATIIPRSAAPTPDPSSTRNALVSCSLLLRHHHVVQLQASAGPESDTGTRRAARHPRYKGLASLPPHLGEGCLSADPHQLTRCGPRFSRAVSSLASVKSCPHSRPVQRPSQLNRACFRWQTMRSIARRAVGGCPTLIIASYLSRRIYSKDIQCVQCNSLYIFCFPSHLQVQRLQAQRLHERVNLRYVTILPRTSQ